MQSQKNKIFMIWNSPEQKIYLDEFQSDELKIKRIDGKAQIYLDKDAREKKNVQINISMENDKDKKFSHIIKIIDDEESKFQFKSERSSVYNKCLKIENQGINSDQYNSSQDTSDIINGLNNLKI